MKSLFFYVSIALLSSIAVFDSHSMDKNQEAVLASKEKVMSMLVNNYIEDAARLSVIEGYAFGKVKDLKEIEQEAESYVGLLHRGSGIGGSGIGRHSGRDFFGVIWILARLCKPEVYINPKDRRCRTCGRVLLDLFGDMDVRHHFSFYRNCYQLLQDFNKDDELRIVHEFTGKDVEELGSNFTVDSRIKDLVEAYVSTYNGYVEECGKYITNIKETYAKARAAFDFLKHCKSVVRKHYIDTMKFVYENLELAGTIHKATVYDGYRTINNSFMIRIENIVENYEDFLDVWEVQEKERRQEREAQEEWQRWWRQQRETQEKEQRQEHEAQEAQRRRYAEAQRQQYAEAQRLQQEREAKNLEFCKEIIEKGSSASLTQLSMLLYGRNAMSPQELLAFCIDPSGVIKKNNLDVYNDIEEKKGLQNSEKGRKIYRCASLLFHPDRYAPTYGFNPGVQHFAAETFKEIGKIN